VEPLIQILQGIGIYQKGTPTPGCIVSEEWFVREEAAKALGHFNDTRSVPALLHALKDTRLREKASGALVELGPQVMDQLVDFHNDPEASHMEEHNQNIMSFATNRLDAQAGLRACVLDILTQLGWTPPEEGAGQETRENAAGDART
jgi:HEAT repeat protein